MTQETPLSRLIEFLKIPSISTDPAYANEVKKCAHWASNQLTSIGFDSNVIETKGHPMVLAHYRSKQKDALHILFYGHYDVQPVDPLELWENDPFDPQIMTREDGTQKIVARGAADDKGQVMTFIEACRAILEKEGDLPVHVSIFLEGEEESGSPSLEPFLKSHKAQLQADMAFICDTNMWGPQTPAITVSLRGLVGEEITIKAADKDLHSGYFGGAAQNPLHVLTRILGKLHDDEGAVTLEGFYEGVQPVPAFLAKLWQDLNFDDDAFLKKVGLSEKAGEKNHTLLESLWSRPTLEINGIQGGYSGEGFKTVLPATASAKISCRLVGDQDPEKIRQSLRHFVQAHLPEDCTVEFHAHGGSKGIILNTDHPMLSQTQQALEEIWQKPAALVGLGGSIPVVEALKEIIGLDSIMVGFGLDDDQIHSPNEKYEMISFEKGIQSWMHIVQNIKA